MQLNLKQNVATRVATLVLLGSTQWAPIARAQSAEDIVRQHLDAVGVAKLAEKQQVTVSLRTTTARGEAPGTVWMKRPNKLRRDAEVMGNTMTQMSYDGQTAWRTGMVFGGGMPTVGGPEDMRGEAAERAKENSIEQELGSPLFNYAARGLSLALVGKEELDGSEVHVITATNAKGEARTFYIEAESFTLLQVKGKFKGNAMGQSFEAEYTERWSDYTVIGGVSIAMTRGRQVTGAPGGGMGGGGSFISRYAKVDFDTPVDDAVFAKPTK